MRLKILAFDQSSRLTGWAFGTPDQGNPIFGTLRSPKREVVGEQLAIIYDGAGELMDDHAPDLVVHEKPFFPVDMSPRNKEGERLRFSARSGVTSDKRGAAFNPKVITLLQKVEGIIQLQAARRGVPVEAYGSRSWPPTILGGPVPHGADVKAMVRQRCRILGMTTEGTDESDAIGIWYHSAYGGPAAARAQGDLLAMAAGAL